MQTISWLFQHPSTVPNYSVGWLTFKLGQRNKTYNPDQHWWLLPLPLIFLLSLIISACCLTGKETIEPQQLATNRFHVSREMSWIDSQWRLLGAKLMHRRHSMNSPCLVDQTWTTASTLCSEKKHPLTFSFISPCVISRFKQKLQWIYLRNGRFW